MDKNSITGLVLIGLILFGFTWYQSRQYSKQMEIQAQLDSVARVEALQRAALDSVAAQSALPDSIAAEGQAPQASIYKDSLLEVSHNATAEYLTLENDKIAVTFTTQGAQPYSVLIKDYKTYEQEDLYIVKPGAGNYSFRIYAGEYINTSDFVFSVVEQTGSSVVMRLPFAQGGYIEQKYELREDSYSVDNLLSFVGMQGVIPRNVSSFDLDFSLTVPRMEKGYRNESQYSKIDYYFEGDKKPEEVGRGKNGSRRIDSKLSWFAFQQQFFSAILRAPQQFSSGQLSVNFIPEGDESHDLMACAADMRCEFQPGQNVSMPFEFYFGPNHFQTLKAYDLKYEKIIPLGGWLVGWFTRYVIIPLFNFLHRFIGNFGIIILLMTIIIKIVVMPLTNKSYKSTASMSALKPEIDKLNEKYPKQEDAMKKQQATMELYKKAGISPAGGCLPMLLTFPILWAMFRFFPASIELRQQSFLWCKDLSAYDSIVDFGTRVPLIGDHLSLFALLMAVTMWFYSKMTVGNQPMGNDPNSQSMRFMSVWMMPIMMFFICNNLSAALSYYYLLSNLFMMLQNWILRKFFIKPEEIRAKLKAAENKPVPKSKWQQRLEEAQRMQQAQLKEKQKQQYRK